ncbi:MAG: NADH:flavin oxidoreductase [Actinobacteria bacterium]|nr:NADH:flavin oxidoreductase [Actinomycetota bacterium]
MSDVLSSPLRVGSATIRNRVYRAPVLEGAGSGPDAADTFTKAFVPNARHGVGLIIQGSACVYEEGRTSPGMTLVHTRELMLAMAEMVREVHDAGAAIFLQIGHGGVYAMEGWHEPYASERKGPLLAASPLPLTLRPSFRGVPVHVMSTDEVHALCRRNGEAAGWAREAGYDGIQLGSANAKLLDQFLSPFYNRRTDEFGGSPEKRAHILRLIREHVADHAGPDFPCTVKVPAEKAPPFARHVTFDEAMRTCELVAEWGYDAVTPVEVSVFPDTTLSRGGVPSSLWKNQSMKARLRTAAPSRVRRATLKAGSYVGGRRNPFDPVWNRTFFREAKRRVSIPVFAVGGIRTGEEARQIVADGEADMVGFGRPFYAQDDLAQHILGDDHDAHALCQSSNLCVPAQLLGMKGVCYNPEVKKLKAAARQTAD